VPLLEAVSNGSDPIVSQWSNTHCGNALPEVEALKC
jgi:hypothetical protein